MLSVSIQPTGIGTCLAVALWCDGELSAVRPMDPGRGQFKDRLRWYLDSLQTYFLDIKKTLGQSVDTVALEVFQPARVKAGELGATKRLQQTQAIQQKLKLLVGADSVQMVESIPSHRRVAKALLKEKKLVLNEPNIASIMTGLGAGYAWSQMAGIETPAKTIAAIGFMQRMDELYALCEASMSKVLKGVNPTLAELRNLALLVACAEMPGVSPDKRKALQAFGKGLERVFRICRDMDVQTIKEEIEEMKRKHGPK